jgi:uridine monophosphate synthetase
LAKNSSLPDLKREIMRDIYENRMLLTARRDHPEGWKLLSGIRSPFYIQLRILNSFPATLKKVAEAMSLMLKKEAPNINRLVGVAFAGVPIATALSIVSGIPACHTRKFVGVTTDEELQNALAQYGQHTLLEGEVEEGDQLCLVDDLVTQLDAKMMARTQVMSELEKRGIRNVKCDDVAVLIDRQQGASERAKALSIQLHTLIKFKDEGLPMIKNLMPPEDYTTITGYLADPSKYQARA